MRKSKLNDVTLVSASKTQALRNSVVPWSSRCAETFVPVPVLLRQCAERERTMVIQPRYDAAGVHDDEGYDRGSGVHDAYIP